MKRNVSKRVQLILILFAIVILSLTVLLSILCYYARSSLSIIKMHDNSVSISFTAQPDNDMHELGRPPVPQNSINQLEKKEKIISAKPVIKKVIESKPVLQKKTKAIKKIIEVKSIETKKTVQEKKPIPPKKIEERKVQKILPPEKPAEQLAKNETVKEQPVNTKKTEVKNSALTDIPTTISMHRLQEQAALLALIGQVEESLSKVWQGPQCAPGDTHCQIKAKILVHGAAESSEIVQHSSSIAFDIAARNAVAACIFPIQLGGREQIFEF